MSSYSNTAVADYLLHRFGGFRFLDLPPVQALEDYIWETGRKAQLRRQEAGRLAKRTSEDAAYVARSVDEARDHVYEPMERDALHAVVKDANVLEADVRALISVHQSLMKAWDEHGIRDAEDHSIYAAMADEHRSLRTRFQGLEYKIVNLEEARTAILAEMEEARREATEKLVQAELRASELAIQLHETQAQAQEQQNRAEELEAEVQRLEAAAPEPYRGPLG
jgi:hypothetical protein